MLPRGRSTTLETMALAVQSLFRRWLVALAHDDASPEANQPTHPTHPTNQPTNQHPAA